MDITTADLVKSLEPQLGLSITPEVQLTVARFSPDGNTLVATSFDAKIRRWDVSTDEAKELAPLKGHSGWSTAVAFRAEGNWLFTADSWGKIAAWDLLTTEDKPRWTLDTAHDGWVRDLAVSSDGKTLVSCGSDAKVCVAELETGKLVTSFTAGGRDLFCIRFAPDGQSIIVGDDRGIARRVAFDGKIITEYAAAELFLLSRLQDVGGIRALAIDAATGTLAIGGCEPKNGGTVVGTPTLILFDLATGERKEKFSLGGEQEVSVVDIAFHSSGLIFLVTCGTPGQGKLCYVKPGLAEVAYENKKFINAQSLALRERAPQLAVVTTAPGSNGNGRPLDKEGNYKTNTSPVLFAKLGE